jgi:sialate O-acetylesterase
MKKFKVISILFSACFLSLVSKAEVRLPKFISEGMVLQRDTKIPVWGFASPGEKVSLTFKGKGYTTTTHTNGKWKFNLAASGAGGPYEMTIKGLNIITIKDILIGDVWICSGQSNMWLRFSYKGMREQYQEEIDASANPNIRLFNVPGIVSFSPLDDLKDTQGWLAASPKNLLNFSTIGYFFAKELYAKYQVPIGLLSSSFGGTPAEAWVSADVLKQFPEYETRFDQIKTDYSEKLKNEHFEVINKSGKVFLQREPSTLYNAMVAPLIPYAFKGVIWYQGEGNSKKAKEYQTLFPALIKDWRKKWGRGNFPFLYVQLANFKALSPQPQQSDWAELREAQTMTLTLPKTGMATTIDIGETNDIHPLNKKDVGYRLSLAAQKVAYGDKQVVYSGPLYKSMKIKDNKITLRFSNLGSGLMIKVGVELKQFAIAGADKKFVWANAKIEGDKIVVWNDQIVSPLAVRYAWADNPEGCNLYNKEGLPASPFRTDSWLGIIKRDR